MKITMKKGLFGFGLAMVMCAAPGVMGAEARNGTPLTQTFDVTTCDVSYDVFDANTDTFFESIVPSGTVNNPPCNINIEAVVSCGALAVPSVTLELLSGTTVVKSSEERFSPYFLFGNKNSPPDILSGSIAPGSYSIRVQIAKIIHTPVSITLAGTCFSGYQASPVELPSFGKNEGDFICGGTLIHPDMFLTAAHCKGAFTAVLIGAFTAVSIGGNQMEPSNGEYVEATKEIPHPGFSMATLFNDIMLVKLARPANSPVQSINYDPNIPRVNEPVLVVGYVYTRENGVPSSTLLKTDIQVLGNTKCSNYWKRNGYSVKQGIQLCAGDPSGNTISCQGDSGSPLYYTGSDGSNVQVGIVSYGKGCATAMSPPVYTRLSGHEGFIEETICKESSIEPSYCNT